MSAPTISSLPNELLVAIAAAGQEGRVSDLQNLKGFKSKSEWTLSHLSRRFREAIVNAPTLWTFVEVNLGDEGSVEIFKLYLERSRACHISVTLQYRLPHSSIPAVDMPPHLIAERIGQIVPHVNRIWRLHVALKSNVIRTLFRYTQAPNLQHLEIENVFPYERGPVEIFSSGAPRLTSVKITGFKTQFPVPPWTATLTDLELWMAWDSEDSDGTSFCVAFIAQCPLLVNLVLDTRNLALEGLHFHIPSLRSLRLLLWENGEEDDLVEALSVFDTPALTELVIANSHGHQIFVLFNATHLPHMSFPALTSLIFTNGTWSCTDETDHTISSPPLLLFPALSSLSLINQCCTPNLINNIFGPSSQPWPLLEAVTLCPQTSSLVDVAGALRSALPSRHEPGQARLKWRLSPALFFMDEWREMGADAERFDPTEVLHSFESSTYPVH
jgi:hypothetical protein